MMAVCASRVQETVCFHKDVQSLYVHELLIQRNTGELCDVCFCVNGFRFWAHKAILAASSPFFRSMFTSRMREESKSDIDLTESLPIADADTFADILNFMYTGDITLTNENVEDALRISDFLLLDDVKEYCRQFLLVYGNLNLSNCLRISVVAEQHNLTDLAKISRDIVHARFHDHIIYSDEILDVHVTVLRRLLVDSDATLFTNADQLANLVIRWVNFVPDERGPSLASLLSCLHLYSLSGDTVRMLLSHPSTSGHENIRNRLCEIENSMIDSACSKSSCNNSLRAEKISPLMENRLSKELGHSGEDCLVAIAAVPTVKFFRVLVYRVRVHAWSQITFSCDDVLDSIPARLGVSAITVHADVAYVLLTMNLPYPSHLHNINILRLDLSSRRHSLLTFQHCLHQGALACHTTLTDEQYAPPVIVCCHGYLCIVANQEGSGQLLLCDIENQTYMSFHIPGTRFISLARAVVTEDRYVYIWCRHRFGHEEYCINKEVSFTIFDCKTMTYVLDIPAPPGVSYMDFITPHVLCAESECVFLHQPAAHSLVFDPICNDWLTLPRKTAPVGRRYRDAQDVTTFPGREVWCSIHNDVYILQNPAAYSTSLSCLKATNPNSLVPHTPSPGEYLPNHRHRDRIYPCLKDLIKNAFKSFCKK